MPKNFLFVLFAFCFVAVIGACKSTNSVELFRINDNGEIVNIGHGADEGHVIYGHFRDAVRYDRAAATLVRPTETSAVCYINVNDGQTNEGQGDGIRIDPCVDIYIVNEGKIFGDLDDIGLFYHTSAGSQGIYQLHVFAEGGYKLVVSRPVDDALWAGNDILKRLEDGNVQLLRSENGNTMTEILSAEDLRGGAYRETPRVVPAQDAGEEVQENIENHDNNAIIETTENPI